MADEAINQVETPQQGVSLSLQDLVLLMNLIRATTERGAIRAEEMTEVGAVYTKLVQFLTESGAIQQSAESQAETAPTKEKSND
jgi:hypothetical protein|tara:strand:+ start:1214 stop:1465 length:252 start_codon:yes stop_codon:yes gene_type:complete